MAWNPSPEVGAARDFGKKFGKQTVIVLHEDAMGRVGYASYGETRRLCNRAGKLADVAYAALFKAIEEER